jgi:hypothetical protein
MPAALPPRAVLLAASPEGVIPDKVKILSRSRLPNPLNLKHNRQLPGPSFRTKAGISVFGPSATPNPEHPPRRAVIPDGRNLSICAW